MSRVLPVAFVSKMTEEDFVSSTVKFFAKSQGLVNYSIIKRNDNTIGDNYFGTLIPATIKGVQNGQRVSLNILLKSPPKSEYLRNQGPTTLMYEREIFVYTKLLPAYERIQETLAEKIYKWPACFFVRETVPEELLVLQDLRPDGYRHNKDMFFDYEHTQIAVRTLARFHSLSLVLEETDPNTFEKFCDACSIFYEREQAMVMYAGILSGNLQKAADMMGSDWAKLLTELSAHVVDNLKKATSNAKRKVIGHSDAWKCNILFKYEDEHPSSACLIDYQTTQLQSPAFDLLYLITTSTNSELRKSSFQKIIQTYYSALKEALELLAIEPSKLYSFEDLERDLKSAGPACVILSTTSFRNWCNLESEFGHIFDKKRTSEDPERSKALYVGIVKDILKDFTDYGFCR